jgi:hypothetical protein
LAFAGATDLIGRGFSARPRRIIFDALLPFLDLVAGLFLEIVVIGRSSRFGQLSKGSAKVFQLFLRARTNHYFKARSAGRDTETDHARAVSVFRSIEDALDGAKAEQAGLKSRIDDVLARAAITQGNDSDEYLTRDPKDSHYQSLLNAEIANGQRRLNELGVTIEHFQFLKTALITRFPDFKLSPPLT